MTPKVLIANGVNLDLLGQREPEFYGARGLGDLEAYLRKHAPPMAKQIGLDGVDLQFFQSNNEAEFLSKISLPCDGILINPAAWTHTSLALADRLKALGVPFVEVHISNIAGREAFRHHSYSAPHAAGVVYGLGFDSYMAGLWGLLSRLMASF